MTTIDSTPRTRPSTDTQVGAVRAPSVLLIRWTISPLALVRAPGAAGLLNGHAATLAHAELEWRVEFNANRTRALARCTLHTRQRTGELDQIAICGPHEVDTDGVNIDFSGESHTAGNPRLLSLSLHPDGSVRFARTSLLAGTLQLPGGVYDAPKTSLHGVEPLK